MSYSCRYYSFLVVIHTSSQGYHQFECYTATGTATTLRIWEYYVSVAWQVNIFCISYFLIPISYGRWIYFLFLISYFLFLFSYFLFLFSYSLFLIFYFKTSLFLFLNFLFSFFFLFSYFTYISIENKLYEDGGVWLGGAGVYEQIKGLVIIKGL